MKPPIEDPPTDATPEDRIAFAVMVATLSKDEIRQVTDAVYRHRGEAEETRFHRRVEEIRQYAEHYRDVGTVEWLADAIYQDFGK